REAGSPADPPTDSAGATKSGQLGQGNPAINYVNNRVVPGIRGSNARVLWFANRVNPARSWQNLAEDWQFYSHLTWGQLWQDLQEMSHEGDPVWQIGANYYAAFPENEDQVR